METECMVFNKVINQKQINSFGKPIAARYWDNTLMIPKKNALGSKYNRIGMLGAKSGPNIKKINGLISNAVVKHDKNITKVIIRRYFLVSCQRFSELRIKAGNNNNASVVGKIASTSQICEAIEK